MDESHKVPTLIDDILGRKRDELCVSCFKRPRMAADGDPVAPDLCEHCDEFTHIRDGLDVIVASYDDNGNRVNLSGVAR